MDISERKRHALISKRDLNDENITTTAKIISANPEKFYLLAIGSGFELYEAIENLAEHIDDSTLLTRIRIACEINFTLGTYLQLGDSGDGGLKVESFSELLEKLEYDEAMNLKHNNYHVVVDDDNITHLQNNDDEASHAVASLFQQTVFLNINLDIRKKSEIRKSLIKERFRENYAQLREEVVSDKVYIDEIISSKKMNPEGTERAKMMTGLLDKMLSEFEKAGKRPIRIAAMGTKKAGKSVIINNILKREFAPTSSELPTPNIVKYIPEAQSSKLTLYYEDKILEFESGEALYKYILGEFKKAQKNTGEGSELDDMIVHYPSEEFSGFEIWDTPGSDFAGAQTKDGENKHEKIAEACIKSADICIFVVNYSVHLRDSEVDFLRKISTYFRKNNKFYSLFIAINRIDERYTSGDEKSANRLVDYIRSRLGELGYENVVLFGTSALQSFYLDKVLELAAKEGFVLEPDEPVEDFLRKFRKAHKEIVTKYITQFNFIDTCISRLRDFHDIENPTASDIWAFSGMPQLERYIKYIGEQKIDTEIVDGVVSQCEKLFDELNNAQIINKMLTLRDEDKKHLDELAVLVEKLEVDVKNVIDETSRLFGDVYVKAALYKILQAVNDNKRVVIKDAKDRCSSVIKNSELNADDVKSIREGSEPTNIKSIYKDIEEAIVGINKETVNKLSETTERAGKDYAHDVEREIAKAQQKILQCVEEVKRKITNVTVSELIKDFKVPAFPLSLEKMSVNAPDIKANAGITGAAEASRHTETETLERTETVMVAGEVSRKRGPRDFWEYIMSFFGEEYYEKVKDVHEEKIKVPYTVIKDVYDVDAFKTLLLNSLIQNVEKVINEAHEAIEKEAKDVITKGYSNIQKQCEDINKSYNQLFKNLANDISLASDQTSEHKKSLENDIDVLQAIDAKLKNFFDTWDKILYAQNGR